MERLTSRNPITEWEALNLSLTDLYMRLKVYEDAEEQGLLVRFDERMALSMLAGARAIEQNPRKYLGTTFVHDVFGNNPKKIAYYDAAKKLREEAEKALEGMK